MVAHPVCSRCGVRLASDSTSDVCRGCRSAGGSHGSQPAGSAASGSAPGWIDPALAPTVDHRGDADGASGERLSLEPGRQLGGYRILRLLGKGGMGAVFEAEHLESGRVVALKVLKRSLDSSDARRRFLREGRLAAAVNHPHSVYVYGTEELDGSPAIAMELVTGGTLAERVQRDGPLSPGAAVDAILQVVAGLEAAQRKGVLHRDVKPSNCMVDLDGNVKVGDFGLSISTAARDQSDLTATGVFLGTPGFSSPEQLRGDELDVRSDIYSVGVTLYYLLTGRAPFESEQVVRLLATVLERPPDSPRKWRPEIPAGLAAIVLRCLQKQPGDRYRSYDELRAALQPYASVAPDPATLGLRCVAYVLDSLLLFLLFVVVQILLITDVDELLDPSHYLGVKALLAFLGERLLRIAYFAIPEGIWGATPGRLLCRLRVAGADRSTPGMARAVCRGLIFSGTPALPHMAAFALEGPNFESARLVAIGLSWLLFFALFSTARRRNGYAGWHDLASGTRVVAYEAFQLRSAVEHDDELGPVSTGLPTIGPYHVLMEFPRAAGGDWVLGFDTRLLRRVWIQRLPAGAPPAALERRELGRVGRLRWLNGRRGPSENWDAYEALAGHPLVALLDRPRPWREVRFWMADVAGELASAMRDRSTPGRLALDQIWITAEGRAKLLDFPAPGVDPSPAGSVWSVPPDGDPQVARRFVQQLGRAALTGDSTAAASTAADPPPPPPVPLPPAARAVFERSSVGTASSLDRRSPGDELDDIVVRLRTLVATTAEATPGRRWLLALAICLPSLATALTGLGLGLILTRTFQKYPDVEQLATHLTRLEELRAEGWNPNERAEDAELAAIEAFVAQRFADTIRDPARWQSPFLTAVLPAELRAQAESIVERHGVAPAERIEAARPLVDRMMAGASSQSPADRDVNATPFFILLTSVLWLTACAVCSLIAALVARGGLLLWAVGLTVVNRDGSPASRLRVLARAAVVWSPLTLLPMLVLPAVGGGWTSQTFTLVVGCLYLGLVIVSASLPRRGLPDRLAGTWLVPR